MLLACRFPLQFSPTLLSRYPGCVSGAGVAAEVELHSEIPMEGTALGCQGLEEGCVPWWGCPTLLPWGIAATASHAWRGEIRAVCFARAC